MKNFIGKLIGRILWIVVPGFRWLSTTRFFPSFWRSMYAGSMMGAGFGAYFNKRYVVAIERFEVALQYGEDYMEQMICEKLGEIYEKGLGVDIDKDKASEYYLRAGFNGDTGYLHAYSTKRICDEKDKS